MSNVADVEDLRHPDAQELPRSPDPARLAYSGRDGYPRVIPIGFLWKQMARITIAATWARYYDFGAGRLPTFLHRLLDSGPI